MLALEQLGIALRDRAIHAWATTMSIGLVSGGTAPNIVPAEAELLSDRRMLPGESAESVRAEVENALREHGVTDVEIRSCTLEKGALSTDDNHPSVRACQAALAAARLPVDPGTVAFGTDAGVFAQQGVPGVVLGPGSVKLAHTAREYVPIPEVDAMTEVLVHLLTS